MHTVLKVSNGFKTNLGTYLLKVSKFELGKNKIYFWFSNQWLTVGTQVFTNLNGFKINLGIYLLKLSKFELGKNNISFGFSNQWLMCQTVLLWISKLSIASCVDCLRGQLSPGLIVSGVNCLRVSCLRGQLSPGLIVSGVNCLRGQLSPVLVVSGASCLRG